MDTKLRAQLLALLAARQSSAGLFWYHIPAGTGIQSQREPTNAELLTAVVDHFELIESAVSVSEYEMQLKDWYERAQKGNKPTRPELPDLYFVAKQELAKLNGEALTEGCFLAFKQQQFDLLEATVRADYYQRVAEFLWSRQPFSTEMPAVVEYLTEELEQLRGSTNINRRLN